MKIYSWNILRDNQSIENAYTFIEGLDFDVLCLQEVTDEMLERFETMPLHKAYGIDKRLHRIPLFSGTSLKRLKENKIENNYLMILSKYPLIHSEQIPTTNVPHPLISRIFEYVMAIIKRWKSVSDTHAFYADIQVEREIVRVFCIHLTLWTPETRRKQFESIIQHLPENGEAVLCGDFNILEWWPITLLNFLFGGKITEMMPWYSERKPFEEYFAKHGLQNPHRGSITHPFSRSQLDHILIPKKWKVGKAEVIAEGYGSDHKPIYVEATPS